MFIRGDEAAFREIFFRYYKAMHYHAFSFTKTQSDADDIIQDVFIKLWRHPEKIKPDVSLKSYLYKTVGNKALDHLRAVARRGKLYEAYRQRMGHTSAYTADHRVNLAEFEKRIKDLIEKLPAQRKKIFLLHYREEKTPKQIADELNIREKTVRNQISKAYRSLRDNLRPGP